MIHSVVALLGLILLARRWWPFIRAKNFVSTASHNPLVSIIIPARNEEHNIDKILNSLSQIKYPNFEVIVVDDQSTDRTLAKLEDFEIKLNSQFRLQIIRGLDRPSDWMGKQWACHQGVQRARGEYLLFTDADTVHKSESLQSAIDFAVDTASDLVSAMPWHICDSYWEKAMGFFHVILLTMTAPFSKPRKGKVYAIGQYLLFKKNYYDSIGGHASVKNDLVEDIPLANLVVSSGGRLSIWRGEPLFEVKMYARFSDFVAGWRRNFRAGMRYSSPDSFLDALFIVSSFTAAIAGQTIGIWFTLGTLCMSYLVTRRLGGFTALSFILFPFALAVFCVVSLLAAIDNVFRQPLVWKNRSYKHSQI